ncbi:glycosyltransferase family A protein [Flavobacterium album]
MPYFSVVIPLYNKENYIAKTLDSVLGQTFTDFEVIIVNDVSTDNSLAVAQRFTNDRIRIIYHEQNKGLSASRNTGIKNSQAEFVAFLDADDLWQPQFLEKIFELTVNYPNAGLFATKYDMLYPNNILIDSHLPLKNGIIKNFFDKERRQHIYCYSSICIKKNVFEKVGMFDEKITMGEDVDFNVRANLDYQLAYFSIPLACITVYSENQITHSSLKGKVIMDHNKYERENPNNQELKKYLDFHRYTMAKRYKMGGNIDDYRTLLKAIDLKNLNYKQRILLMVPAFVLRLIKKIKAQLHKRGLNPTSY